MHRSSSLWYRRSSLWMTVLLVALIGASPASAYLVYLKDGSQIQAKEKYRIEGDLAILVLPSGATTSMPASEIDMEKTEEVNQTARLNNALLIEGREVRALEEGERLDERETLTEYLAKRRAGGLSLPDREGDGAEAEPSEDGESVQLPRTPGGYVDFGALRRAPYPDAGLAQQLVSYLRGQGIEGVETYRGSRDDRMFVEIITNSEALVFKALEECAQGFVQLEAEAGGRLAALEVLMVTSNRQRGGQFVIDAERAEMLVTQSKKTSAFFLDYVEF